VHFLKKVWEDFKDFWKSQVVCAVILVFLAALLQWHYGIVPGHSRRDLVIQFGPYVGLVLLFVIGNFVRTTFIAEKVAHYRKVRSRRREEHHADRALESEKRRPIIHEPNLQFGRVFPTKVFVGHEMSGNSHNAWVVEVRNELSDREIGPASTVRAQITYKDKKNGNILHTLCPARWETYQPKSNANIHQAESCPLILVFDNGFWSSDLFEGVRLPDSAIFEVRLIDQAGKDMSKTQSFMFRTWGIRESDCTKI
jgi:hypothetical protein